MDIDEVNTVASAYAAKLGLGDPEVRSGRVASWVPIGLRVRMRRGRPVLVVGSPFGELAPVEQEAMLAGVMAAAAAFPGYKRRLGLTTALFVVTAPIPAGVTAGLFGRAGYLLLVPFLIGWLATMALSTRWLCFAIDRKVMEAFGRPIIDVALDFERRNTARGFNVLRAISPDAAQRTARLDRLRTRAQP